MHLSPWLRLFRLELEQHPAQAARTKFLNLVKETLFAALDSWLSILSFAKRRPGLPEF